MLPLLDHDALQPGKIPSSCPLLVACLHDEDRPSLEGVLEQVAQQVSYSLRVCIVDDQSIAAVMQTHAVAGTPTFLLFKQGEETARFLGKADSCGLLAFLKQHLAES